LSIALLGGVLWVREAVNGGPAASPDKTSGAATVEKSTHSWDFSRPLPITVKAGASYVGGFLIGWTFRRFIRIAVVLTAAIISLIGFGKYAGCDTAPTQAKVKETSTMVQHEATVARDYLKKLLPTASAAAVGTFLGFRRKDNPALSRE
jgi:uncharacterized membrane protein (Fun14 family)